MSDTDNNHKSGCEEAPASAAMPSLLTQRDVAVMFRCTPRSIRNWSVKGWLKPVRIGRRVFYRCTDVEVLLRDEFK